MNPYDPDPLHTWPCMEKFRRVPSDRHPYLCTLPVGHDGPHDWPDLPAPRSNLLILGVILAAVATGAIIALLWWGGR